MLRPQGRRTLRDTSGAGRRRSATAARRSAARTRRGPRRDRRRAAARSAPRVRHRRVVGGLPRLVGHGRRRTRRRPHRVGPGPQPRLRDQRRRVRSPPRCRRCRRTRPRRCGSTRRTATATRAPAPTSAAAASNCIKYTWNSSHQAVQHRHAAGWRLGRHRRQQVCSEPFDQIGIYVKIRHDFVTHIFGASITLDDHSVFRFEPTPSAVCSSS